MLAGDDKEQENERTEKCRKDGGSPSQRFFVCGVSCDILKPASVAQERDPPGGC